MSNISGTKEWANSTVNCVSGCSHNCRYCYAKVGAIRRGEKTAKTWEDEKFLLSKIDKVYKKVKGTVMMPSQHDITIKTLAANVLILERLLAAGNNVLIVSKPHFSCIRFICKSFRQYKDQILFRFTIGSANNDVLSFWEPNAPNFEERLKCLQLAYGMEFSTSVSMEPFLDGSVSKVVEAVSPFVTDAIWIGKANKLVERLTVNGHDKDQVVMDAAEELIEFQKDDNILKLYEKYKDDSQIKWKESIKKVVGLELPTEKGMDV